MRVEWLKRLARVGMIAEITSLFVLPLGAFASDSNDYKNVYGQTLQPCSAEGMALTGYTRSGYCVDRNDDAGSHHICIDLSSTTTAADDGQVDDADQSLNFCQVTGQSNWCDSSMPCHDDTDSYCPVQNWCVCQWAFASYVAKAGGCDAIQNIVCESINQQAVLAYQASLDTHMEALECLVTRCNLPQSLLTSSFSRRDGLRAPRIGTTAWMALAMVTLMVCSSATLFYWKGRSSQNASTALKQELVQHPDRHFD